MTTPPTHHRPDAARNAAPADADSVVPVEGADLAPVTGYPAAHFDAFLAARESHEPAWLTALRLDAMRAFRGAGGFPTTRSEEYKYTYAAVKRAVALDYTLPAAPRALSTHDLDALGVPELGAHRLVFVDGRFCESASRATDLPDGVTVRSLAAVLADTPDRLQPWLGAQPDASLPFALLNAAFFVDGAFIEVARNVRLEAPIHLVFVGTAAAGAAPIVSHARSVLVAHTSAELTVVESHVGLGADADATYLSNVVTSVHAGANATVRHARVVCEAASASHVGRVEALVGRDSHVELHDFSLGGRLVRNDASALLDGEGGHVTLNGLYLTRDRQHVDNHTSIDHAQPHCTSSQLYKGILDGRSTAVFNGKVFVRPDAQKTNGEQSNRNLLLSRDATVNTKPQLEIWADDVRCTHGATIGRLDAEALFYLESRGIAEREAQALLTFAFAAEVIETVHSDALRHHLESWLDHWMPGGELTGSLHAEDLGE